MASKDFTPRQVEVLLGALEMSAKSFQRRINAETDPEAAALWSKKLDEVRVLQSKIRLT